jgi:hypothetical protein
MITAGSRWLSVIMVCLVAGCHQAPVAERPTSDTGSADPASLRQPSGPTIVAFSLRAAERLLREPEPPGVDVATLGGITRPLGLVYDPEARDLLIVGQVGDGDPVHLDDLVVMMRTVLERGTWPLCSIDRTPETASTGRQTVRFEGLANTSLGADCFLADTTLKSLALGQALAEDVHISSYFDMLREGIQQVRDRPSVSSRLWGYPLQPSLISRGNTFAIRDLEVGVQAEAVPDSTGQMEPIRDEIAEAFAQQLTQNYDRLSRAYPALGKVATMFRLAALAYGMRSLPDAPDLGYWLDEYLVPPVMTETEYPVLRRTEMVDVEGETLTVDLEGGIKMEEGTLRLEDGDLSVLREAVLQSRPDPGALTWRVPLRGAWLDSDAAPDGPQGSMTESRRSAGADAGAYLTRRVAVEPGPVRPPGVGVHAPVNGEWRLAQNQQVPVPVERAPLPQPLPAQPAALQVPLLRPPVQPQGRQSQVSRPYPPPGYRLQPNLPQPRIQQPPIQRPPLQVLQPRVQQQVPQSGAPQPPVRPAR